jgi:hypothetical protein
LTNANRPGPPRPWPCHRRKRNPRKHPTPRNPMTT